MASSPTSPDAPAVDTTVPDGLRKASDSPALQRRKREESWKAVQSGILFKKGTGLLGKWQSRYWVLYSSGDLVYYSDRSAMSANGRCATVAQLQASPISVLHGRGECKDCSFPSMVPDVCCLAFVIPGRTYYMYASSLEEVKQWKTAIETFSRNVSPTTPSHKANGAFETSPSSTSTSPNKGDDHAGKVASRSGASSRIRSGNTGRRASFFWKDRTPKEKPRPMAAEAPAALGTAPAATAVEITPQQELVTSASMNESISRETSESAPAQTAAVQGTASTGSAQAAPQEEKPLASVVNTGSASNETPVLEVPAPVQVQTPAPQETTETVTAQETKPLDRPITSMSNKSATEDTPAQNSFGSVPVQATVVAETTTVASVLQVETRPLDTPVSCASANQSASEETPAPVQAVVVPGPPPVLGVSTVPANPQNGVTTSMSTEKKASGETPAQDSQAASSKHTVEFASVSASPSSEGFAVSSSSTAPAVSAAVPPATNSSDEVPQPGLTEAAPAQMVSSAMPEGGQDVRAQSDLSDLAEKPTQTVQQASPLENETEKPAAVAVAPVVTAPVLLPPPPSQGPSKRHRPSMAQLEMIPIPEKQAGDAETEEETMTPSTAAARNVSEQHNQSHNEAPQSRVSVPGTGPLAGEFVPSAVVKQEKEQEENSAQVEQSADERPLVSESPAVIAAPDPTSSSVTSPAVCNTTADTVQSSQSVTSNPAQDITSHVMETKPVAMTNTLIDNSNMQLPGPPEPVGTLSNDKAESEMQHIDPVSSVKSSLDESHGAATPACNGLKEARPGHEEVLQQRLSPTSTEPHQLETSIPAVSDKTGLLESKTESTPVSEPPPSQSSQSDAQAKAAPAPQPSDLGGILAELEAFGNSLSAGDEPTSVVGSSTGLSGSPLTKHKTMEQAEDSMPLPESGVTEGKEPEVGGVAEPEPDLDAKSMSQETTVPAVPASKEVGKEEQGLASSFLTSTADEVPAPDLDAKSILKVSETTAPALSALKEVGKGEPGLAPSLQDTTTADKVPEPDVEDKALSQVSETASFSLPALQEVGGEDPGSAPSFLDTLAADEVPQSEMEFRTKLERERWELQQMEERQAKFRRMSAAQLREHEAARLTAQAKIRIERERRERERLQAEEQERMDAAQEDMRLHAMRKEKEEESVRQRMMKIEEDRQRLAEEEKQRLRKVSGSERRRSVRKQSSTADTTQTPKDDSRESTVLLRKTSAPDMSASSMQDKIDAERQAAEEMERRIAERRATMSKERDEQRLAARRKKEAALAAKKQQEMLEKLEKERLEEERKREAAEQAAALAKKQREMEEALARERQEKLEAERRQAEEHDQQIRKRSANLFLEQDRARKQREAEERQREVDEEQRKQREAEDERKRLEAKKEEELQRLNARPKATVNTSKAAIEERQKQLEEERLQLAEAERQRLEKAREMKEQHERESELRRQERLKQEQALLLEKQRREAMERAEAEEKWRLEAENARLAQQARTAAAETSRDIIAERERQMEEERLQLAEAERQRLEKARELKEKHEKESEQRRKEKLELEEAALLARQKQEEEERKLAQERWKIDAKKAQEAHLGEVAAKEELLKQQQQQLEEERAKVAEFDRLIATQRLQENKEELKRLERERAQYCQAIQEREELERRLAEKQKAYERFRAEESQKASALEKERVMLREEQLASTELKVAAERRETDQFEERLSQLRSSLGARESDKSSSKKEDDMDVLARREWESRNSPIMVMRRHSLRPSDIKTRKTRKLSMEDESSVSKFQQLSVQKEVPSSPSTAPASSEMSRRQEPRAKTTETQESSAEQPKQTEGIRSDKPLRSPEEVGESDEPSPSVSAARLMWETKSGQSPQSSPRLRKNSDPGVGVIPKFSLSGVRSSSPVRSPLIGRQPSDPLATRTSANIPSPLSRSRATSSSSTCETSPQPKSSLVSPVDVDREVEQITSLAAATPSGPSSAVVSPLSPSADNVFSPCEALPKSPTPKCRISALQHATRVRRNSLPNTEAPHVVHLPRPSTPVLARVSHLASDSEGESSDREEDASVRRQRQATKWVEKELNKLIQTIKDISTQTTDGKPSVTYRELFEVASEVFEALSGTLLTARKHKIVTYEGDLLLQGLHDSVVIVLLEENVPDGTASGFIKQRKSSLTPDSPRRGRAFSGGSLQSSQSKCHVCGKTVYPVEFVGADDRAFHKTCFKCLQCQVKLTTSNYATIDGKYYCKTHYQRLYREKGDYSLM